MGAGGKRRLARCRFSDEIVWIVPPFLMVLLSFMGTNVDGMGVRVSTTCIGSNSDPSEIVGSSSDSSQRNAAAAALSLSPSK